MKKALSLVMAIVLVLSLAACSNKTIVGKWVSDYELKNILDLKFDNALKSTDNRLLSTVLENLRKSYEDITVKEILQINEDNTYKLYFDTGNAKSLLDKNIRDITTKTIEEDKDGSKLGTSAVDSVVDMYIDVLDFEKALSTVVEDEYKIEGDKFYFSNRDAASYGIFTIKGDKLSFSEVNGSIAESEKSSKVLIREFTRTGS